MNARNEPELIRGRGRKPRAFAGDDTPPVVPAEVLEEVVRLAARAPSVHNTQPWRFAVTADALELSVDCSRWLRYVDPEGREMLISCGAALFGMRLGVRRLGYHPVVELMPIDGGRHLLARIRLGARSPFRVGEQTLWEAARRRYILRGGFTGDALPPGLLTILQRQAEAEGAALVLIHQARPDAPFAALATGADRRHLATGTDRRQFATGTDRRQFATGSERRYLAVGAGRSHAVPRRTVDLARAWGRLAVPGGEQAATALLTTAGDTPVDWLRAGQALYRLLLRAAADSVFATLHTDAVEIASVRAAVRTQLRLQGAPHMFLQFGRARTAELTPSHAADSMVVTQGIGHAMFIHSG